MADLKGNRRALNRPSTKRESARYKWSFWVWGLKARTHMPPLGGSSLDSTSYNAESADSTTYFTMVCGLSISNMFNILNPLDLLRPTIGVGQREIGLVGMGLKN